MTNLHDSQLLRFVLIHSLCFAILGWCIWCVTDGWVYVLLLISFPASSFVERIRPYWIQLLPDLPRWAYFIFEISVLNFASICQWSIIALCVQYFRRRFAKGSKEERK